MQKNVTVHRLIHGKLLKNESYTIWRPKVISNTKTKEEIQIFPLIFKGLCLIFLFLAIFNAIKTIWRPFGDFVQIWAFPGKPDYNHPQWKSLLILKTLVIKRFCNLTGQDYKALKEVFQILIILVLKCRNRSF